MAFCPPNLLRLSLFFFLSLSQLKAQTNFWSETFDDVTCAPSGGCPADGFQSGNGSWTVTALPGNTGTAPNSFYVSCTQAGTIPGFCAGPCTFGPGPPPGLTGQTLHIGSNTSLLGDIGAIYSPGSGQTGISDANTEIVAESPVINTAGLNDVTITFSYIEGGDSGSDRAEFWLKDQNTGVWTLIDSLSKTFCCDAGGNPVPCSGNQNGTWVAISIILPAWASDNAAGIKLGFSWSNDNDSFGTNPSFAVDNVFLYHGAASSNTLAFSNYPSGSLCTGLQYTFSFQNSGTFNAGNQYSLLMSDSVGNFSASTSLGTISSTALNDFITFTLSPLTPLGSGYLFQLVSTNPPDSSAVLGPFQVNDTVLASVGIVASQDSGICAGAPILFVASPVNGGPNPSYQWQLNGLDLSGETNDSLIFNVSANGDIITVVMTSSFPCAVGSPANSNPVSLSVSSQSFVTVNVSSNLGLVVCSGDVVDFSSVVSNGGSNPLYQWLLNGSALPGETDSTFSTSALSNGDEVALTVTSSLACSNADTASLTLTVQQFPNQPDPIIGPLSVCAGTQNWFAVPAVQATSYIWSLPQGWSGNSNADSLLSLAGVSGGTISVSASNTCGSSVAQTLPVNVSSFDTSLTDYSWYISSNDSNSTYQWIDCLTNSALPGETNRELFPAQNGIYAVILTQNSCADTSACFNFVSTSLKGTSGNERAKCHPVPAEEVLFVSGLNHLIGSFLFLYDAMGRIIQQEMCSETTMEISLQSIHPGVYFIHFSESPEVLKFIRR